MAKEKKVTKERKATKYIGGRAINVDLKEIEKKPASGNGGSGSNK